MSSRERKPVVLTTVPFYLPGFKGGGKMITIRNLVAGLGERFHFKVLTANHDLGDRRPYEEVTTNRWISSGPQDIFYAPMDGGWISSICEQIRSKEYDILHLNTVFSRPFGIFPLLVRRFGLVPKRPTIIAPRGELGAGALAIKGGRKRSYLEVAQRLGLFAGVVWQATSEDEARDIREVIGIDARVVIAPDLLSPEYNQWETSQYHKRSGRIDVIFLSRISPKKNLHLAIEALRDLEGDIVFRIAGPIDDSHYWTRCREAIATLPSNVRTEYLGPIAIVEVNRVFAIQGLLLLPTANENFGFAIIEAFLAGCPVLISDQTPWRNLAASGIGWDVPLASTEVMRSILQQCIAMDAESHRAMSLRARQFALDYLARDDSANRNAAIFNSVLEEF